MVKVFDGADRELEGKEIWSGRRRGRFGRIWGGEPKTRRYGTGKYKYEPASRSLPRCLSCARYLLVAIQARSTSALQARGMSAKGLAVPTGKCGLLSLRLRLPSPRHLSSPLRTAHVALVQARGQVHARRAARTSTDGSGTRTHTAPLVLIYWQKVSHRSTAARLPPH